MITIEVNKGQAWEVEWRMRAGDGHGNPIRVTLDADAAEGGTTLVVKPSHPAFADGDVFLFGEDVLVVLSDDCPAGEKTMTVTALPCALDRGNQLEKLASQAGATIKAVVLKKRGDVAADAVIPATDITVVIPTQTGDDFAKVIITGEVDADFDQPAGSYHGALWRTDEPRPLDGGNGFTFNLNDSAAVALGL